MNLGQAITGPRLEPFWQENSGGKKVESKGLESGKRKGGESKTEEKWTLEEHPPSALGRKKRRVFPNWGEGAMFPVGAGQFGA